MYGMEIFARGSKSLIESNSGAASIYFSEVYSRDDDERNWSPSYLREQLMLKNCQGLFRKYQMRVQHALFVELLVFNLMYNALALLGYIFFPSKAKLGASDLSAGVVLVGIWSRSLSFSIQLVIFITAYNEKIFRTSCVKITTACLVLFCMTLGETATSFYRIVTDHQKPLMRHTYYIVLTTSVLLPFPRKLYCGISAAAVITIDLMLSFLSNISNRKDQKMNLMFADLIYHVTVLAVGLGIRYLIEIMNRRAFLDRRESIEFRKKVEMEKYQEERFLKTILPNHIASEVREDIWKVIKEMDKMHIPPKPFNKLYVGLHEEVSILYADIVNSMLLAASLNVDELIATLNDLFGRFDDSVEKNGCMRIKLLGDCYYCVSGIGDNNSRHADNCVQTALDMIDIIRSVREQRNIDVDMRIGIHSGNVLGGLLGLRKWQFDIWSRDATIASHMEQGGVPGQVHITRATKDNLKDTYDIYPGNGHLRDTYLQSEGIETFLIKPRNKPKNSSCKVLDIPDSPRIRKGLQFQRQVSFCNQPNSTRLSKQSSNDSLLPMGRRGAIGSSLVKYNKLVTKVNKIMEKSIDKMPLSKTDQWFSKVGIQPLLLTFHEWSRERPFLEQPDPLFKYYLLCMLLIFVGMTLIHILILSSTLEFWVSYGVLFLLILLACIPSWAGYVWLSFKKDDDDQPLDSSILKISRKVWRKASYRISIWLLISGMIIFCSIIGWNECEDIFQTSENTNETFSTTNDSSLEFDSPGCSYPWFYTLCAALAMTTTSVFLRIHFLMKVAVNGVALSIFWYVIDAEGEELFKKQTANLADWEEFELPRDHSHCYYLTFIFLILHVLDRQVEYIFRLDYLTKIKLKVEQEEARSMELVNRMLLFNILPPHVAKYYLTKQLEDDSERFEVLYHEGHTITVAVLFASIPNYANSYYEDSKNKEGLECIKLLNEVICGFDMLLNQREFSTVEKIKTIGSTYMAACELYSHERGSFSNEEDLAKNVVTLVNFSVAMMSSLQELNQDAFQDFQLRIGISVGPVMAGIIGTVKPQFDIWGDTVNVASRMDSTGIVGRIQVTKEVAELLSLSNSSFECECRGEIFVKGKGMLTTYLVKTPYDEPQIQTTSL